MTIEQSRTPFDRSRSLSPLKRSAVSSPNKTSTRPTLTGRNLVVPRQNTYDYDFLQRGSIKTSIKTSYIHIDKGFTGPRFIEDDIADNIPLGDELPDYFAEDFDFTIEDPQSLGGVKPTLNYDLGEMTDLDPDADPEENFEILKSRIIEVGKELNDFSVPKNNNASVDDIIESVITSNKLE